MPELPEVETIRSDLQKVLKGVRITAVTIRKAKIVHGSAPAFKKKLIGRSFKSLERRGKLLIFVLDDPDLFLLMHLKMTGQLIYEKKKVFIAGGHPVPRPEHLPNKFTHIIFNLAGGGVLYFNDLRQFGYAKLVDKKQKEVIVAKYGIEPLTPDFTYENFSAVLHKRKVPLKNVLLDQTAIAGLGNIYVDEACFFAGVRPTRRAHTLRPAEVKKLYEACETIIAQAIKHRGTTFGHYRDGLGAKGNYVQHLKAYGRGGKECLRCGQSTIKKVKVAGRGTAYCAHCQK